MKKILFLVDLSNSSGGLYNATIERINRLKKSYNIILFEFFYSDDYIVKILKKLFKKHIKTNFQYEKSIKIIIHRNILLLVIKKLKPIFYYNKISKITLKFIANEKIYFDLVHAHWGLPHGIIANKISQKFKVPYFITFHGSDVLQLHNRKIKPILLESMKSAKKCFFVSKVLMENAVNFGYDSTNGVVSYNGVSAAFFKFDIDSRIKSNNVAYIGSFEYKKGADFIPQIFNKINKRNQTKFTLIGDGSIKQKIIDELDLNNIDYSYLGTLNKFQLIEALKLITCIIVPSRTEGLGMIILEAHAMGIPVIGSNQGGIPEAIGDINFIVEFDEKLIYNIAKKYNSLVSGFIKFDKAKSRNRVKEKFSWDIIVKNEMTEYES